MVGGRWGWGAVARQEKNQATSDLLKIYMYKMYICAWVAQLVKRPTLAQVMFSQFVV